MPETHQMDLVEGDARYGKWRCRQCSRTILLRAEPYDRLVLEHGNEDAVHTGGTGGVRITGMSIEQAQ